MNIQKQMLHEFKFLLKSKSIVISGIILILFIVGFETSIFLYLNTTTYDPWASKGELVVDGVSVETKDPFYRDFRKIASYRDQIDILFSSSDTKIEVNNVLDLAENYFISHMQNYNDYEEFQQNIIYLASSKMIYQYMFENVESNSVILEISDADFPVSLDKMYINEFINMSNDEKQAEINSLNSFLLEVEKVIKDADFETYISLNIAEELRLKQQYELEIIGFEAELIDNPIDEIELEKVINDRIHSIHMIEESSIPYLEYLLENNIRNVDTAWQSDAFSSLASAENYVENFAIKSEEEFAEDKYADYSYQQYLEVSNIELEKVQNTIFKAEMSLENGKPDMEFVYTGSRNMLSNTIFFTILISIFAALVGAGIISDKFQTGTIRMLMMRPKSRTKIFMTKYFAGFSLVLIVYFIIASILFVVVGLFCGFSDYQNPNYTINGEVEFLTDHIIKLLASFVSVIFAYSFAFALSAITKITAIALILPVLTLIGSSMVLSTFFMSRPYIIDSISWMIYTPLPYINISDLFIESTTLSYLVKYGLDVTPLNAVIVLVGISVLLITIALAKFKKEDIKN